MSDFIVQFDATVPADRITEMLTQSNYLKDREVDVVDFDWGRLFMLRAPGGISNLHRFDDEALGFIGRPRFVEEPSIRMGSESFFRKLKDCRADAGELSRQLTGMYCLLRCNRDTVEIDTDMMGAQPVYQALSSSGKRVAIGTNVEVLAEIAGRVHDFDTTSLAELLVFSNITFPYSSRNGISELEPACRFSVSIAQTDRSQTVSEEIFWEPVEQISQDSPDKRVDELVARMRSTGDDIASSSGEIGLTLSGGLDSRAVLSVLPAEQVTAITYVTHENFETDTARRVAETYGCRHVFARRDEDYFSRVLLQDGPVLMGMERRAMLHGLCMVDAGLDDRFDVILGGQLSDTYIKHHYMPKWQREIYRPKGPREKTTRLVRKLLGIPQPVAVPGVLSTMGRYLLTRFLSEDSRAAVEARRSTRLEEVRKIRPQTCEEWVRFWPTSRQDDLSHVMGNMKLLQFETLFSHRHIVEFATTMSPWERYDGRIANKAFSVLYGSGLDAIHDANTGLSPGVAKGKGKSVSKIVPGDKGIESKPWNNVATSWFDLVTLQQADREWDATRTRLRDAEAFDVLLPLLGPSARDISTGYQDFLGPTFNQMFIQLGLCVSRL